MKIEVELSEETAACIWQDHHREPLPEILSDLAISEAAKWRNAFPNRIANALEAFRQAFPDLANSRPSA